LIIVPRFSYPQNSRWAIRGKVRKENTKWSFERMPRVRWGLSNDNYDSESTLKLVPTLSHIYRTRIPRTSKQTRGISYNSHTTKRCRFFLLFLSRTNQKKKLTLAFSPFVFSRVFFFFLFLFFFLPPSIPPPILPPSLQSTRPSPRSSFSAPTGPNFGPIGWRDPFLGFPWRNILDLFFPKRDLEGEFFLFDLGSGSLLPRSFSAVFVNYFRRMCDLGSILLKPVLDC